MSNKIVKCDGCGEELFELTIRPTYTNTSINARDFMGINGNASPKECDTLECPKCGKDIYNEIVEVYQRNL